MYQLIRPLLFRLEPERAHELALRALNVCQRNPLLRPLLFPKQIHQAPRQLMGLTFPNGIGLAAGADKNGEAIDAFGALGFGFVEVGTVTPKAQEGNPKPRQFRLIEQQGIINRNGFNNLGVDYLVEKLKARQYQGIVGVNIGKNAITPLENAADDYLHCLRKVYAHADYVTVNISSPNTKQLRSLQYGEALSHLLTELKSEQAKLQSAQQKYVPLVLKIAPDLTPQELEQIADALLRYQFDGVIATNTTLDRQTVADSPFAEQAGGLSGKPLAERSTLIISQLNQLLKGKIPIIGVGGIDSVQAAQQKLDAGAQLLQIYSALIYQGPQLIQQLSRIV